jgi:periplasmic protein TonB
MPSKRAWGHGLKVSTGPRIGPGDRLGATLALALIAHGVVVLGIGFALDDPAPVTPTLDVILVETQSPSPPDQADFLAQASQQGGGDRDRAERPREQKTSQLPVESRDIAPQPMREQAPPPLPPPQTRVLASTQSPISAQIPEDRPEPTELPMPTGRELIQQTLETARLAAEVERRQQLYAKRPKRKFVSASTREYEFATYLRAWVARVERIGNLNYPEEARRRELSGRLVMTVAVRRDGSVEDITVVQPSGYSLLDQAATRVVRLAEPFPPLPRTDENVDILHITRTWQFLPGGLSSSE